MNVILLVWISHLTYLLSCLYFGQYEEKSEERSLSYYKSNINFLFLHCISCCFPVQDIPTSDFITSRVFLAWIIIADLFFTCAHRLLHTKTLYWLHKQHHSNHPTFSTSTFDAHILEFFFVNVCTAVLPMLLIPGSNMAQLLWVLFANINTVSGHHLEGPHLVHHKLLKYNYGQGFYFWDKIAGTYKK